MSATKRGKQKQQAEVSEEDFETFVRESLGQLSKGQKQIIQDISNLKAKVKLNETALDKNLANLRPSTTALKNSRASFMTRGVKSTR